MCVPLIAPLLTGASAAGLGAGGAALAAGQAGALAATTASAASAISLKTAISLAGQAFSAVNSLQQQQAAKDQAKRQNEIAFRNRLNQQRMEGLRIRQVGKQAAAKTFQTALEAKQARATVATAAENFTGGALNRLLMDYYRQEGRYNNVILSNLEQERAQSTQNYINFVTGQEANQTFVPQVDPLTTFASAALNFGNDYLSFKTDELDKEREERIARGNLGLA